MSRKMTVLASGLGLALMGFGEPAIKDGSLVGWWRFDNSANYKEDSSGYGSSINDQEKTATLVDGVAVIDVSDCIEMGEDYAYDAVTENVAADLDEIAAAFAKGDESRAIASRRPASRSSSRRRSRRMSKTPASSVCL